MWCALANGMLSEAREGTRESCVCSLSWSPAITQRSTQAWELEDKRHWFHVPLRFGACWLHTQHCCGNRLLIHSSFKITICGILGKTLTFMSSSLSSWIREVISSPRVSSSLCCLDQMREHEKTRGSSFQKRKMCSKFSLLSLILLCSSIHEVLSPSSSRGDPKLLLIPGAQSGHFHLSYPTGGKLCECTPSAEANLSCGVLPPSESQWCFTTYWNCCQR